MTEMQNRNNSILYILLYTGATHTNRISGANIRNTTDLKIINPQDIIL